MTTDETTRRSYLPEIFLASLAGLLLEIGYTRIISFKLFYYYTYLVIGLALLGIGTGGVIISVSRRLRAVDTDRLLMWSFVLGGASVGLGYLGVARIGIDTQQIWDYGSLESFEQVARLVAVCLGLFGSFVAIGVIVATLFARRPERIGTLYFADLVGAGVACAVVVSLLGWIGAPSTILLAGLVLGACGVHIAWRLGRRNVASIGGLVSVLLALGVVAPGLLPEPRVDATKVAVNRDNTVYSSWSAIFRVDVGAVPGDARLLFHDALLGSAIHRWNGDVSSLSRFDRDPRRLAFEVLGSAPDNVMIIGAAGGHEILASLYFDARHIDAVELNPVTYDLVTDEFADYAGNIAEHPRVNYVNDEGRSYLARGDRAYDLVWYPAPDSYAASNASSAGAFVLSESYLYTREAIVESFDHLGRGGLVATQFGEFDYEDKPNRTTRYVATARDALAELGIDDPRRHILVATSPTGEGRSLSTILVAPKPFTDAQVERFVEGLEPIEQARLRYAPGASDEGRNHAVSDLVTTPDAALDQWYDDYPYDVRPITDNKPFFWHFVPYDDVASNFADPIDRIDFEDALGERVLLLLFGIAFLLSVVFLLLPFFAVRSAWKAFPRKGRSAAYFVAVGIGFIFFEVALIQRLILFLGYPTYSLTVTLMSLLIFTGIGALLSNRRVDHPARAVPLLLAVIAVLAGFYAFGLVPFTDALIGLPLAVRVVIAFLVLAPLGLCLGSFMPLGLRAIAGGTEFTQEYVAWGWAVNGVASVMGSVLSTILAMTFGFQLVLGAALVAYVIALLLLRVLAGERAPAAAAP